MIPDTETYRLEKRPERHEQPTTVCHPNGTVVAATDHAFLAAACRAVLVLHDEARVA